MPSLKTIPLQAGWRCAVVGAVEASVIAGHLTSLVGRAGHVVVVDTDAEALQRAGSGENVSLRLVDVGRVAIGHAEFDLVVAAGTLARVQARSAVLDRLIAALKPGGWLLVEETDHRIWGHGCDGADVRDATAAVVSVMERRGVEPTVAIRIPEMLAAAGLVDVDASADLRLVRQGHPADPVELNTLDAVRPTLVGGGLATDDQVDALRGFLTAPTSTVYSPITVSAWGRKPEERRE